MDSAITYVSYPKIACSLQVSHVLNAFFCLVTGCVNPIADIVQWSHAVGAKVLVDACQSVPHMPVDVQGLGGDFLVASSHKVVT